jgi:hypothetical protein
VIFISMPPRHGKMQKFRAAEARELDDMFPARPYGVAAAIEAAAARLERHLDLTRPTDTGWRTRTDEVT